MKIEELFEKVGSGAGWWTIKEHNGKRVWTPHFGDPPDDGLFPFLKYNNAPRKEGEVANYQAYALVEKGMDRTGIKKLYQGLMDALKLRSETDVLSPGAYEELIDRCAGIVLAKSGLNKQNPRRLFLVIPPSSSPVAKHFAEAVQRRLKIPNDQMFLDHFTKRDAIDIALDVMDNEKIHPESRAVITDRLENWSKDDQFAIKLLKQGHRNEMHKAGVQMFDPKQDFDIKAEFIPYLIIVDDNTQTGTTARSVAQTFIGATGKQPGSVVGLAMFKYP